MTNLTKAENPTPNNGTVRVTQMAGDTATIDHADGMTVAQALANANITVDDGNVVTMNGQPVEVGNVVEPNSVLVVCGKIRNG